MHRRDWLLQAAAGAAGIPAVAGAKLPGLKITDVKTILTAPAGIRLVVVKVLTSEPGLYGLGCATFTQRARVVETAVDKYLKPFLIGKDPLQIEDIWQSSFVSSYWRNGPVLGNAISGVDMALWDILGKRAGLPVYQLLGGKCRKAVDTYRHASGDDASRRSRTACRGYMDAGLAPRPRPGRRARPLDLRRHGRSPATLAGRTTAPSSGSRVPYVRTVPQLFEHLRKQLGDEVELLHDMHERVPPILAMQLAQGPGALSPVLPRRSASARRTSATSRSCGSRRDADRDGRAVQQPQRMGAADHRAADRLHPHPHFADRRPDDGAEGGGAVRVLRGPHRLARPGRRLAGRPCRQRPSRPGHARTSASRKPAQFTQAEQDVFPGCPELKDGYYWANDSPGLGIDLDEKLAAKFPIDDDPPFDMRWGNLRRGDGTVVNP